ncbi:hypothetical protein EZS27_018120 [termite gut metagenome]|jgi:hypothetical protein|uniref:Uncharacterized protein n=1 Tax=termite gut metagenome TaxID=433724 RepID=A0A5J4RK37_9ZZZZ
MGKYIKLSKEPAQNNHINAKLQRENFEQNGNDKLVFVSIKNLQNSYQCFSEWTKSEMSKFWDFNRRIHQMTWQNIYDTANTGKNKRGMAYTSIPRSKYKSIYYIKNLSKDIDFFELRVDGELRVHGFREKSIFQLCLLDREHTICK